MEDTKSVAISQVSKALQTAQAIAITDDQSMKEATDVLSKIKKVAKILKDAKEVEMRPLLDEQKRIREHYALPEQDLTQAESLIKGKMLAYQKELERKAREEEVKVMKKVETGYIKPETAVAKLENIQKPETSVKGESGAVSFRTVKKVQFAPLSSLSAVQLESLAVGGFIVWDEPKTRKEVLTGAEIPGTKVVEEKEVASR